MTVRPGDSARNCEEMDRMSMAIVGTVFNAYDRQNIAYSQYWTTDAQVVTTDVTFLRRTYDVALRVAF